jgi:hypothetical protein
MVSWMNRRSPIASTVRMVNGQPAIGMAGSIRPLVTGPLAAV